MKKRMLLLSSVALVMAMGTAARADGLASDQEVEALRKQVEMLTQQVDRLATMVESQGQVIDAQRGELQMYGQTLNRQSEVINQQTQKIAEASRTVEETKKKTDAIGPIAMGTAPKFTSADGKYSFQPFGRVHLDATVFQDDDNRDHPDNAHFRRARLGVKGDLGEDFNYKVEFDFGGETANFKEVYLGYTGLDAAELWLGHFKPPVGLEQSVGSNFVSLTENAAATSAFTRDEVIGVMAKSGGENWSIAGGFFNEDAGANNAADDESWSGDARASVDLLQESPNVLHFGAGGSIRKPNAVTGAVTTSAKPAGTGNNMVTTGAIAGVDRSYVYGAEVAGVYGPFHAQAEYIRNDLDLEGAADPSFDGWYAQAALFLTGEMRPYNGKAGSFDRVKPLRPFSPAEGGIGAWELVTRYDTIDLNDQGAGILGGEMSNWVLGLNWYLTSNIRMMLNYMMVDTDENAVVANDDPNVINLRAQWDF